MTAWRWFGVGAVLGTALVVAAFALQPAGRPGRRLQHTEVAAVAKPGAPAPSLPPFATDVEHPNILLIIGDDYGQDQVGAYKVHPRPPPSPRIDALAAQGMLFRNVNTNPVCSPTRATIMTGRYSYRYGIGSAIPPRKGWGLPEDEKVLARVMKEASGGLYHTAMIGKWHLATPDMGGADHARVVGFDHHFGTMGNLLGPVYGTTQPMTYFHWSKVEDGEISESHDYVTTVTTDDAIRWAGELPEPWLIVVSYNLTHYPQHLPPPELFTQEVVEHPTETDLYRLMAEALDTEVGRLVDHIDAGVRSRTDIIFMGDNGTAPIGVIDPFPRTDSKGALTRGGVAVPFIVAGPSVRTPGSESSTLINSTDLFATIVELAGLEAPAPADSVSFAKVLQDPTLRTRRYAYAEHFSPNGMGPWDEHGAAVMDDRYKLVVVDGKPEALYDSQRDPLEQHNLLKLGQPPEELRKAFKRLKYVFPEAIELQGRPTDAEMRADGLELEPKLGG
ncbi:MAG TPA: sulfatase-like hydrolase/transferase [Myxococcota bacterium]|nr:sulfatase-like hydrolase/transferase [Myxococcota bacterium]